MARMGFGTRLMRLLQSFLEMFIGGVEDEVSPEARLKVSLGAMEKALDARADSAALSMAIAQQTRNLLVSKLAEYDQYTAQAKKYKSAGDDEHGKQAFLLAQQAEKEISRLNGVLTNQQATADRLASEYAQERKEVKQREAEMPAIAHSARVAKAEERFSAASAAYNIDAEKNQFDKLAEDAETRSLSSEARAALKRDPQQEMRDNIARDVVEQELNDGYSALKAEAGNVSGEISQESVQIEHKAVDAARDLLSKPRLQDFARERVLSPTSKN